MRAFTLERDADPTGVSGTGKIAEGIEFDDGRVALRWCVGEHRSTVTWDSIQSVQAIHGHDGKTRVVWWTLYAPLSPWKSIAMQPYTMNPVPPFANQRAYA